MVQAEFSSRLHHPLEGEFVFLPLRVRDQWQRRG